MAIIIITLIITTTIIIIQHIPLLPVTLTEELLPAVLLKLTMISPQERDTQGEITVITAQTAITVIMVITATTETMTIRVTA